jgi:hypothetical protein
MRKLDWSLNEGRHAGPEHLDHVYVATYDLKSPTDWSEDIALLLSRRVPRLRAQRLAAGRGLLAARAPPSARLLEGDRARPDRPHAAARRRLPAPGHRVLVRAGGGRRDDRRVAWLSARGRWTREQLADHVREEHSTFTWLLEPMLERAGFEIRDRWTSPNRVCAIRLCPSVRGQAAARIVRSR